MGKQTKAARRHSLDQDVCPSCGKDDGVSYDSPDMEDSLVYLTGSCGNCDAEWTDTFKLSDTVITRDGGDDE